MEERLLTSEEAARLLNMSPGWLYGKSKKGEIPRLKLGRSVRYDPSDLRKWIEAQK
jgi:excisionase family DNA binding protein